MRYILLAVSDRPASEGFGSVIVSALLALAALALMYGVLEFMNYRHKKKSGEDEQKPSEPPRQASFRQVLDRKMKEKEEKDRSGDE